MNNLSGDISRNYGAECKKCGLFPRAAMTLPLEKIRTLLIEYDSIFIHIH